ncbi:MAG: metallophosphoesterase [Rhodobacteraceae bacterium CG17_big_fil_post_rev_8_21_14_2_50_63_15]|nr:MAG: metallophosphoesterase [Rhodobacteraceae bacterium CG17_big_fil_post_rev_8_21_14_2_50_63_15]
MKNETPKDLIGQTVTVLAHLSDPHLPLPTGIPPLALLNKRLLGLLSWHSRRYRLHRPETLDKLVADLLDRTPDHIMVTGDLTNLGLDVEYRRARAWLDSLGGPERVTVIPGNHEALVSGAWEQGAAHWQPYWQGDAAAETDVVHSFPTLRRRGGIALIALSSAIASPPGLAVGALGRAQIDRLVPILRQTRQENLFRVLLIHHPPIDGTVRHRKRLRDGADLRALLEREGIELVLHGHSHKSHHQVLQTRDGPAPVIGVPSASAMHLESAAYHLYEITPTNHGWKIALTVRRLGAADHMETSQSITLGIDRAHAMPEAARKTPKISPHSV